MDVQSATAPAHSAPVTFRPERQAGTGDGASSVRAQYSDVEIAPAQALPPVMDLQLDVDQTTKTVIGRIVNPITGEVIKQIPTEEMVHLMARNAELLGALLNKKA